MVSIADSAGAGRRKIFGVGLSKTGTSSLCQALRMLGYRAAHNPTDDESMLGLLSGNLRCRAIKENGAVCDIMFSRHFRELDRLYPGSLFILTERDREGWHASCARHWSGRAVSLSRLWNEELIDFQVYGTAVYRRSLFDDTYDQHCKAVIEHFSGSDRLLRLNICAGEGWVKLCGPLGAAVPAVSFPHVGPPKWFPPSAEPERRADASRTARASQSSLEPSV